MRRVLKRMPRLDADTDADADADADTDADASGLCASWLWEKRRLSPVAARTPQARRLLDYEEAPLLRLVTSQHSRQRLDYD